MKTNLLVLLACAILAFVGGTHADTLRIGVTKVEASSQYPEDGANYHPENAIDGNSATAWFPQRTERGNKGEWIKFHFEGKPTLEKFVITNGWVKNDALWRGNSRIAKARLTFSDGSERVVMLSDVKKPIEIDLKNKTSEWMQLTIETIYAGQQWNTESGITDVVFFGQAPVAESEGRGATAGAGVAVADVRPPSAALNGGFRWSRDTMPKDIGFVVLNNRLWQDQPTVATRELDWTQARQYCRDLKLVADGLVIGGFDLPTTQEYRGVIEGNLAARFKYRASSKDGVRYWLAEHSLYKHLPGKVNTAETIYDHTGNTFASISNRNADLPYYARCVSRGGDVLAKPVTQIAQVLAENDFEKASRIALPDRPARPLLAAEAELTKGEFEPSAEFQKRLTAEQARVREANAVIGREYEKALKDWEARAESIKRRHEEGTAARAGSQTAIYLDAMTKAAAMRYGAPVLKSMQYDADAQSFLIEIGSEWGGYASTVRMPVPLALAPRLKELVTSDSFTPDLEMRVADDGMVADGIRQLRDPAGFIVETEFKLKKDSLEALRKMLAAYPSTVHTPTVVARIDELEFAKARDSVAELEDFIRSRSKSPLAEQARARIKELKYAQAQQQLKDIERNKEEAERQKRLATERAQESRLYNAAKDVGDKVCADITTRGLFSSDTYQVSGFVEGKSGNRIQIRITNPRGINSYNGAKLYQGAIIWDQHSNWKACP